ncbi:hypothetical protein FOL46_004224 [Perkinsus olseni]|uniref:Uncharacterized protein n=1 Tax=Perkinsus olseni TaxID=32597 RepID=A0A7J6MSW8_PEROL|nr:hypothetical protein FOL46_004224 [Perkinsus olseni]
MSFTRLDRISSIDIKPTKTDGPTNPVETDSYSWYRSSTEEHPRIVVPDFDSGLYVADENQLNQPDCPMESVFQSVHVLNPGFDWQGVDVVTDRTNLRQLIGFLIPKRVDSSGAFVIDVDVVDNTVVFTRTGPTRARCFGCGHHFERAMTTDEADGALRRVVSFELGTLKLVVSPAWTKPDDSILEVARSGGPLEGTKGNFVELKTKSVRREFDWVEAYTQMALGDTDRFNRQEVARAKVDNNRLFGRLEAPLAAILCVVRPKNRPGEERSFVIEWDGNSRDLHIREN